jgi:hypothetical protein
MRRARRTAVALLAPALLAVLLLTACVPTEPTVPTESSEASPHPGSADGTGSAALPAGVSVAIYQGRTDVASRRIEISVTNDGDGPLEVTAVRLTAPQFAEAGIWPKDGTTVRPGTTTDLPVPLPPADCSGNGPAAVTLGFRDADGREREATVAPEDRFDRLPALRAEDCLAVAVAAVATLTLSAPIRVAEVGGVRTATLDLVVEPAGGGRSFTLDSVTGTTLLAPADPGTGARREQIDIARRIDSAAKKTTLPLAFVPNRCDAHAIAEDKRGTILPLHVTTDDGTTGIVPVAADPDTRSALYAFVAESCGLS